jgi:hypothetical protein
VHEEHVEVAVRAELGATVAAHTDDRDTAGVAARVEEQPLQPLVDERREGPAERRAPQRCILDE